MWRPDDHVGLSDDIGDGDVADGAVHEAGIFGIVAVIAEQEQIALWHGEERGIVGKTLVRGFDDFIGGATGQGFEIFLAFYWHAAAGVGEGAEIGTRDFCTVDVELAGGDLNSVAGQADDAFDEGGGRVAGWVEGDDAATEWDGVGGEGFGDDVITNEDGWDAGAGGDVISVPSGRQSGAKGDVECDMKDGDEPSGFEPTDGLAWYWTPCA